VDVCEPLLRGLYSYGKTHELYNTAYLNGVASTTAISTKAVFSRAGLSDQAGGSLRTGTSLPLNILLRLRAPV